MYQTTPSVLWDIPNFLAPVDHVFTTIGTSYNSDLSNTSKAVTGRPLKSLVSHHFLPSLAWKGLATTLYKAEILVQHTS